MIKPEPDGQSYFSGIYQSQQMTVSINDICPIAPKRLVLHYIIKNITKGNKTYITIPRAYTVIDQVFPDRLFVSHSDLTVTYGQLLQTEVNVECKLVVYPPMKINCVLFMLSDVIFPPRGCESILINLCYSYNYKENRHTRRVLIMIHKAKRSINNVVLTLSTRAMQRDRLYCFLQLTVKDALE